MSHFVRCDRCSIESAVMGTVTMPPGWLKVFSADLCERCCEVVRDFIRFTPSDAAALPIEPIPAEAQPAPEPSQDGDKLFEVAPVSADSLRVSEHASNGELVPKTGTDGDPEGKTQPASAEFNPASESNAEERARGRKAKRKARDPIPPEDPTDPPPAPGVQP